MKLVVKNLEYMQGRDGLMLNCDFSHKGKTFLHAHDDGNGGCLDYYVHPNTPENQLLFNQLKSFVDAQPEYDFNKKYRELGFKTSDEPNMKKLTVEDVLNDLIDEKIAAKEKQTFNRDAKKSILVGNKHQYAKYWWKKVNLAQLVQHPKGKAILQAKVDELKAELKEGQSILNAEYLRTLGITV